MGWVVYGGKLGGGSKGGGCLGRGPGGWGMVLRAGGGVLGAPVKLSPWPPACRPACCPGLTVLILILILVLILLPGRTRRASNSFLAQEPCRCRWMLFRIFIKCKKYVKRSRKKRGKRNPNPNPKERAFLLLLATVRAWNFCRGAKGQSFAGA